MRFGSLASGIEAASVAWKPLGMTPAFFSEIDPFCCSLLSQRQPDATNLGDMNDITTHALRHCGPIDCLVFGTPCQAWSVAGERGGLEDPRGQLTLRAVQLLEYLRPRWFVWENVPGVLSANSGRDLGCVLGEVAKLGYGWAYRILDAQYFGVPQRRRRIFLVGNLGSWARAAAVLFEPGCVPRNSAKGGKAKQSLAGTITSGSGRRRGAGVNPSEIVAALTACGVGTCGADDKQAQAGHLVPALTTNQYADRESEEGKLIVTHTLRGEGFDASEDGTGRGTPLVPVICGTLNASMGKGKNGQDVNALVPVAFRVGGDGDVWECGDVVAALTTGSDPSSHIVMAHGQGGAEVVAGQSRTLTCNHEAPIVFSCKDHGADAGSISPTLRAMGHSGSHANAGGQLAIAMQRAVRRLTPRECERLQGFEDDYTLVRHRGKPAADGPRYKAIGNSIAIPVLRRIGKRLLMIDGSQR